MPENTNQAGTTGTNEATAGKGGETIPKARFDEVYGKMKDYERQIQAVLQQAGAQTLEEVPQVLMQRAGDFFTQIVAQTGTAPQISQYLHQAGMPIPEIDQLAQQQAQQQAGMGDMDDPYMTEIQRLKAELEQSRQQFQQFQSTLQQQQVSQFRKTLHDAMAEAVHKVVPGAKGAALESMIEIMAGKAMQMVGNSLQQMSLDDFLNQVPLEKIATESAEIFQQAFMPQGTPQGQQGAPQTPAQGTPQGGQAPMVPGQGAVPPDEDAALEAKKQQYFEMIAHPSESGGEAPASGGEPAGAAGQVAVEGG